MCFQCLKELMKKRRESKRARDFKPKESPQSEPTSESKTSESESD